MRKPGRSRLLSEREPPKEEREQVSALINAEEKRLGRKLSFYEMANITVYKKQFRRGDERSERSVGRLTLCVQYRNVLHWGRGARRVSLGTFIKSRLP
jgi:hypothetical protein